MTRTLDRFFGPFAGDALARERASVVGVFERAPRGTAHCEGCARRKPIVGLTHKGWRCVDCAPPETGARKRQKNSSQPLDRYPQVSNVADVAEGSTQ